MITILDNDTAMSNLISGKILSKDQIKNIRTLVEFVKRDQRPQGAGGLSFTGDPRGLSIESYISRFYSISRGVVSPRYVGTEAIIQTLRMNNHKLLTEMFTNKDVAEAMADIIVSNKKLPEARVVQINNILKAVAARSIIEYQDIQQSEIAAAKILL